MFALSCRWVTQIKFISANNPFSGKYPQFRFFCVVKRRTKVSLQLAGSQTPSTQNNPYVKMAYFEAVFSGICHTQKIFLHSTTFQVFVLLLFFLILTTCKNLVYNGGVKSQVLISNTILSSEGKKKDISQKLMLLASRPCRSLDLCFLSQNSCLL